MAYQNKATKNIEQQLRLRGGVAARTLTGNVTCDRKTENICFWDPGGASRDVTLGAVGESNGLFFIFKNEADNPENLVVKNAGGSTIVTINQSEWAIVACDGTTWQDIPLSAFADILASANTWALLQTLTTGARVIDAGILEFGTAGGDVVFTSDGTDVDVTGTGKLDFRDDVAHFVDPVAPTKRARIDAGSITAGQTRVLAMPDADVTITSAAATILDDVSVGAIRTTLGVGTGDSPVFAGAHLTGNLIVDGSTVQIDAESMLLRANYLLQNVDYTAAVGVSGGLVVNYLPTATVDTTAAAGVVTAGVDAVSDPTITTAGAATFAATDIVQISGSANNGENDGIYEVLSHAANLLTLKSTSSGVSNRAESFTRDQVVANAGDTGMAITKITVSVARAGTNGIWEVGSGSQTGISYSDLLRVSDIGSQVQAYDATLLSLALLGTAADKIAYTTGVDTWAESAITAAGRAILDDATAAAQATTLGLGTGDSPTFVKVHVGADMWATCPTSRSVLTHDFFDDFVDSVFSASQWVLTADATGTATIGDAQNGVGVITCAAATDNDGNQIVYAQETFKLTSGKRLWVEFRILSDSGSMVESDWFVGLAEAEDLTGVADNMPANGIGFHKDDGAATFKASSSDNGTNIESIAAAGTIANATWIRLGLLFDGGATGAATITPYVDGVAGTALPAITYATMAEMAAFVMVRNGDGVTTQNLKADYVKIVAER